MSSMFLWARFNDEPYLKEQLSLAGKARDQAYATAMNAIRDKLGPDKALLLAHLKHARSSITQHEYVVTYIYIYYIYNQIDDIYIYYISLTITTQEDYDQ